MKIELQTDTERQALVRVAEGWEAIPSCYLQGFEIWVSEHFEDLLRYYGAHELEAE